MPKLKPPPTHREVKPVRSCKECGAYLTSRNEDDYCYEHGGWSTQMLETRGDYMTRASDLQELMEVAA